MGLKCSVLGHTYGEATVEREREEQGSEVVITIQERETCERCGNTRIVSENKEVTSIETPSEIASDMVDDEATASGEGSDADDSTENRPAAETDEEPTGGRDDGTADVSTEPPTESTAADIVDPEADDAEIIDDSGSDPEPNGDSELADPTTDVQVPDAEDDPVPDAAADDPDTDDGLIIDGDDEERDDDREPGQWPDEPGDGGDDWSPETGVSGESEDDAAGVEPAGGTAVTVPEGQFRCPECGFTTEVAASSLRAGDFCPECHKGSLVTDSE